MRYRWITKIRMLALDGMPIGRSARPAGIVRTGITHPLREIVITLSLSIIAVDVLLRTAIGI